MLIELAVDFIINLKIYCLSLGPALSLVGSIATVYAQKVMTQPPLRRSTTAAQSQHWRQFVRLTHTHTETHTYTARTTQYLALGRA